MFKKINGYTIDFNRRLIWGPVQGSMNWDKAKVLEKDGWRLPTSEELKQAFIDEVLGFTKSWFWSSTPYENFTDYVWTVNFGFGIPYYTYKDDYCLTRYVQQLNSSILEVLGVIKNLEVL